MLQRRKREYLIISLQSIFPVIEGIPYYSICPGLLLVARVDDRVPDGVEIGADYRIGKREAEAVGLYSGRVSAELKLAYRVLVGYFRFLKSSGPARIRINHFKFFSK